MHHAAAFQYDATLRQVQCLFDVLFHARQQMRYSAAGDVVLAMTQFVAGVGVLLAGGGLQAVLASNIVAACAYGGFLAWQVRASGQRIRLHLERALAWQLLRKAAPYALVTLLAIVATRSELLLLGALADQLSQPEQARCTPMLHALAVPGSRLRASLARLGFLSIPRRFNPKPFVMVMHDLAHYTPFYWDWHQWEFRWGDTDVV